ncbi:aquaporin-like protein [Hyaloscypha variabilis F]|uniref:Aquaporin-like protein n=1 Tax=Hyaloscypha variabilis (strain UAMH 11265 / GT02V1 / F) TaxID=1149755 RepID=A0A2J6S4H4_HYAVF|nr:aquaporin-like protein [Hyaloscypha variabilis F]
MASLRERTNVEKPTAPNGQNSQIDVENNLNHDASHPGSTGKAPSYNATVRPFIGRLGGNQGFVLDRHNAANAEILKEQPDSAPCMSFNEQFDLRGFRSLGLWKAALIEGVGALMLIYATIWINLSPSILPAPPTVQLGVFDNATFIGPLVGGLTNWFLVTLLTFSLGSVSGAHLNPTITIATFFARLCTLPRMILYVSFQTSGAAIAGLLVRASYGSRDFKTGGCWLFSDVVPVSNAFVVEFGFCLALLFMAFGVGLDPRQKQVIGPALGPFLVGMTLGTLSFGSAFTRFGYGGASMNPARCFGTFVGSRFPGWHWHHWIADIAACIVHGFFYAIVPPWQENA